MIAYRFRMKSGVLRKSFGLYAQNLRGAAGEAADLVRTYPKRFQQKTTTGKILSVSKLTLIPASVALQQDMPLLTQIMGTTALTSSLFLNRFKHNNHVNALDAPVTYMLVMQKALLGAWGYAAMAAFAATRPMVMAALPDTKAAEPLRKKVAVGFAVAGIGVVGATGVLLSPWNFLPMASMLMGTAASYFREGRSHQSRALYFVANLNNAFYSAVYSGSASAVILDGMGAINTGVTINENDMPQRDKEGQKLSIRQKFQGYVATALSPEYLPRYQYAATPAPQSAPVGP